MDIVEMKPGQKICPHCNGYGSSFKDPINVATCTVCGGYGVIDAGRLKLKVLEEIKP